ncbi:hypothetical protein [Shewanella gaetbuli]|uniref:Uncharacterized protein n=1 Tax=Shewanella gaetbuli TaxID=220752 RepID=A0A9X1ZN11_9GAMM|nr:hypothetical protein [Shewanella gaetbuli]MCL1142717.1 hypothetical protein [Shewanella gaetbuli]
MNYLVIAFMIVILILSYLNIIASVIVVKDMATKPAIKAARLAFIWLIPVVGCILTLRFTFQEHETAIHKKCLPRFMTYWVYDESTTKANPLKDDNDLKCQTGFRSFH